MKKTNAVAGCLCAVLFVATIGLSIAPTQSTAAAARLGGQTFDENNVALTFGAITDPHVGYGRNDEILDNTLAVLEEFAPNGIDVILSAGDNTQNGTREEAELFMSVLRKHYDLTKVPAVIAHGNHDTYWAGCMTTQQFYEAFGDDMYTFDLDRDSAKRGNRHIVYGGYHFLTVQIQTFMPDINNLTAETKDWLNATLSEITKKNPEKPVFISCHSPQLNTIYGSMESDATGVWGASKDFDGILNKYPQAFLISGHTHYANNSELSIMQTGYTSFTPGGSSHISANKDTNETSSGAVPDARARSQGTVVEVDSSNNVRITRVDFVKRKQIKDVWIVPAPKADKSHLTYYTAERAKNNVAPTFASNAAEIVPLNANKIRIDYSKAIDDDMVYSYAVTLKNASGSVIRSVNTLSPWLEYPDPEEIPQTLSCVMSGISISYPCSVEIVAKDCWGKESEPLIKTFSDPTEKDIEEAEKFDERVRSLGEITQNSYEEIFALRKQYNAMSYSRKQRVTEHEMLRAAERTFYRTWCVADKTKHSGLGVDSYYSLIPSSSRGSVENSDFCGVKVAWNGATLNNCVGVNKSFDLNGLTLDMGGLHLESESKMLGFMISSVMKDKYTENENLLLQIDFEEGKLYVANGKQSTLLAALDCLKYDNVYARPFTLSVRLKDGAYLLKVAVYGFEETEIALPASVLKGAEHLTDLSAVYVSVTPWAKSVTGELEMYAVYREEPPKEEPLEVKPPEKKKGCGGEAIASCAFAVALSAIAVFAATRKRKK